MWIFYFPHQAVSIKILWFYNDGASVWLPADINFVMHILSSPWFFRQNCHTSRIVLHGNATANSVQTSLWQNKHATQRGNRSNEQNKKCESAAHFVEGFFAVIAQLTLSNLMEMAMQLLL